MRAELRQRLIFGPIFGGVAIGSLAIDALTPGTSYGVATLVSVGLLLAMRELHRLAGAVSAAFTMWPAIIGGLALIWWPVYADQILRFLPTGFSLDGVIIALVTLALSLSHMMRHGYQNFLPQVGAGLLATVYVGLFSSMIVRLNLSPAWNATDLGTTELAAWQYSRGVPLVCMYIAACKLGDVCAFFGGRAFGRHKMAPKVSPGKTWEGFAASLVGSIGGSYAFVGLCIAVGFQLPFDAWWKVAVWGAVVGPVGVLGDLVESCLKRDADVKDSGHSIPGFGGFLDVFDALLLAAPVAYVLTLIL